MKKKTKKRIIIVLICLLVVILLIIGTYFYGLSSVSKKSEKVTFNIEKGTSTREVINDLYEANLIKSKISSLIYVKLHKNIIIQAGTYELNRNQNAREIFNALNSGNTIKDTINVTFVEGKRITDYMKVIEDKFGYSKEDILKVLNDQDFLKSLISKYDFIDESILNKDIYYSLEGYLFPETYEFYKNAKVEEIFTKMLDKTENVLDNYSTSLKERGLSYHELLTIASIIENETMAQEDRSIVSQVIYKRLDMKMSLGMDVTTYYGVRKDLKETLTQSDLNSNNAYNTRNTSFLGLPVGPICNPSEDSIKAALNPSATDYVYFYADKEGKLHFAKTNAEFQELIRKYS